MGEQMKQKHAKGYKQCADRAFERDLLTANLFSHAPDVLNRAYNCRGLRPLVDEIGRSVTLHPKGANVSVVLGNELVGTVTDDSEALASSIAGERHCPNFAVGTIDEASSASGDFVVRVADHTEER